MSLRIEANGEPITGYRLIERIGCGGFGEVWKAEAPGGLLKAIKIIHGDLRSIDADGAKHAEQELRALKRLQGIRHPYLLSLERYDVVEGRLLIVSELADCNLWDRFREYRAQHRQGIPRGELLRLMEEAAEVLDLMSSQYQLQHLDIKPQNLFLMYNHVKVADFGLVKDLEGVRGQITGGVTPVYAAPETFDSIVSRFCDQYSLAIVYQELLTGIRPFNGTSGQQLLLQHLREAPNLGPLPPADRPIVGRALSKKPEDRFPTSQQFVQSLIQAGADTPGPHGVPNPASHRAETPAGTSRSVPPLPPLAQKKHQHDPLPPMETPKTQLHLKRDDSPGVAYSMADMAIPPRAAPPEVNGEGCLVPAVVIGIGLTGLEIVREFRRSIRDRFGGIERLPQLKVLFIDSDSETLHSATGQCGFEPAEVIPARLNRAAHYLKPRRNGRSLIEGWFDPQTLYRIPRNPATVGIRALGRLAFLDHYRTIAEKLFGTLESCTHPDALGAGDRATKLGIRSNRPRVYIVTSLGGGTGSGMFLDVAYAARHKLRQLGYLQPEVIGVLLSQPPERGVKGTGMGNNYAALRELHHFSQADTTFTAQYEERDGRVNDPAPPFARCFVLPFYPNPKPSDPPRESIYRKAATFLANDLFSPLGRAADDARWQKSSFEPGEASVSVFGQAAFVWPRQILLTRAAKWLSATVLTRWTASDPDVIGQYVKAWLAQRWQIEQLGPEFVLARLQKAGEQALGQNPEALFTAEAQVYLQKGWFAREPDPARLYQTLAKIQGIVGMPDERAMQRTIGQIEHALDVAADTAAREFAPKLSRLATTLLEHPDYRLVGAEEAVKQVQGLIDGVLAQYEPTSINLGSQAIDAFYTIHQYLNAERGQKRPAPTAVAEAVRTYPTWRYQSLILRQACRVFQTMKTQLNDQLRELKFCRQRLEEITTGIKRDYPDSLPTTDKMLLPPGVSSFDEALVSLQAAISPDDLRAFDKKLQVQIEQEFNALFNVCLSSVNMLGNLQATIQDQAKGFLAPRLGEAGLAKMFFARFPDTATAGQALHWLYEQAEPPIKVFGTERQETVIVAGPDGEAAAKVRHLAEYALQMAPSDYVPSQDEVVMYREFAHVPLTALPQLGPLGEDAYNEALDGSGAPHTRTDVVSWRDVEVNV